MTDADEACDLRKKLGEVLESLTQLEKENAELRSARAVSTGGEAGGPELTAALERLRVAEEKRDRLQEENLQLIQMGVRSANERLEKEKGYRAELAKLRAQVGEKDAASVIPNLVKR